MANVKLTKAENPLYRSKPDNCIRPVIVERNHQDRKKPVFLLDRSSLVYLSTEDRAGAKELPLTLYLC